jgi:hypothetical protein
MSFMKRQTGPAIAILQGNTLGPAPRDAGVEQSPDVTDSTRGTFMASGPPVRYAEQGSVPAVKPPSVAA